MKIIPIFFYHEKWAVVMRKFVYSSDGVEKMGPLRGDGNFLKKLFIGLWSREDGSPSWGRKLISLVIFLSQRFRREDGSPSWGRKFFSVYSCC